MQKIHFIGIGGIGISALARFLKEQGFEISGSDIKESKTTKELEKEGISIKIPHHKDNVKNVDLVVYSAAIKEDNEELLSAKEQNISTLSRKEALPMILKDKRVFAVAGAHGKSTTSSILASLIEASVIIGAVLKESGTNMLYKESQNIIFEADESDSSFLNSNPYLAIVTNVEAEHLDHYGNDLARLHKAYEDFLNLSKIQVINAEDEFLAKLNLSNCKKLYPSKDIKNIRMSVENFKPKIHFELKDFGEFGVCGMGEHVALDASLAILAASEFLSTDQIRTNLQNYQGIKKRFDILFANEKMALIDDYGHHPTEIKTTLKAAKEYANLAGYKKLIAIFEPHRYTRLSANVEYFSQVLSCVDELYILPVYAAGEAKIDINMQKYFPNAHFIKDIKREQNAIYLDEILLDSGLVIGFGAGDISVKLRGKYV
ncbi:UDP-N-acetylmuramate--L-alanine ligase [Campylobacter volucris]|uniref:UDP-N-acetylmuramate--L-alanine ligase n=1 Tax=Campylobacter volucris TaxID=1031542 RepID=A0AAE5YH29_9BACT|nr:UDP-N-acetylmuramate--L-alanine ligase [Campylobacter volucris]AJC94433.1 UDP-N-acetylmuramate-alanine ligase [Campylobacter volucris LMG 24379]KAB0579005.1 UDP-N-acetylmuramate--L-alanine ligase [Campylobacter volucris]MBF7048062.1 UDP-N-acetylmuramate--L-alanine ligase [Campylobacter volucris]QBL13212.1 UDP-N-acetylmuramate--L-alanine ligase [Campylobacter volucris]QEL08650.1 UDP-N-acetylmuramate-alanine ligase [Campylobacter volucris]